MWRSPGIDGINESEHLVFGESVFKSAITLGFRDENKFVIQRLGDALRNVFAVSAAGIVENHNVLFNPIYIIFFSWLRLRIVTLDVAEDAVADAHIVAFDAEVGEDSLAFFSLKHLFRAVNPA